MAPLGANAPTLVDSAATNDFEGLQASPKTRSKAQPEAPVAPPAGLRTAAQQRYQWHIVWRNVIAFAYLHYAAIRGLFHVLTFSVKIQSVLFILLLILLSGLGITAGAHRLWAHRAYKAKWPLRLILMLFQTLAGENHIYEWVRDHRVHHKFTDSDADPHNARRGFFFSHMGWLLMRKHSDVRTKGAGVDLSDLEQDGIVMFQKKVFPVLGLIIVFVLPTYIPVALWGEDPWMAWYACTMTRYVLLLHGTWLVNSAAHFYGMRPVDKTISPRENHFVSHVALGEGWHNYHHVFPWDYKAGELGSYNANWTTAFIDFFARVGWAYDLKTVSKEMVQKRVQRTGDGSHVYAKETTAEPSQDEGQHDAKQDVWGWGDQDMSQDDILAATIVGKSD